MAQTAFLTANQLNSIGEIITVKEEEDCATDRSVASDTQNVNNTTIKNITAMTV